MRNHQYISRFGLSALMLVSLSACTYLIPSDPSSPRYNTLSGERHAPVANSLPPGPQDMVEHVYTEGMNDGAMEYESVPQMVSAAPAVAPSTTVMAPVVAPSPTANGALVSSATAPTVMPMAPMPPAAAPMTMAAPVAAPMPPALPPVDLLTQSKAQREMAAESRRQTPYENYMAPTDVARSDLNTVPPRPTMWGPNSAQSQLDGTRRELEQDRNAIGAAREQLKRDAAQEPSLIPEQNAVPMPNNGVPQSSVVPMGLIPPPPPLMAPGTAPMAVAEPGVMPMAAPLPNAPIQLRPPNSRPAAALQPPYSDPAPVQAPAASYYGAARDGFDPLATATAMGNSVSPNAYSGDGFMPQSRYKR